MNEKKSIFKTFLQWGITIKSGIQWVYGKFVSLAPKIANHFPAILATGGLVASAVSMGIAQNTSAQLDITKQQLVEVRMANADTPNKVETLATKLADKSAQIDDIVKLSDDLVKTTEKLKKDTADSSDLVAEQKSKAQQISNNLSQLQQNLVSQTQKVEANLTEVQGKIANANKMIDDANAQIIDVSTSSAKVAELQAFILKTTTDIDSLVKTQDSFTKQFNDFVNETQLKLSLDDTALSEINKTILANQTTAENEIATIQSNITDLQNENILQDNADSSRDTRLDSIDNSLATTNLNLNNYITNNNSTIASIQSSITTTNTGLSNYITSNNTANTNIQSSITNLRLKIKSGLTDQNAVSSGTISFGATMPSIPTVSASLYNSVFSTSGFIIVTSVTTTNFSYVINGTPTFGTKISWIAIIDN